MPTINVSDMYIINGQVSNKISRENKNIFHKQAGSNKAFRREKNLQKTKRTLYMPHYSIPKSREIDRISNGGKMRKIVSSSYL